MNDAPVPEQAKPMTPGKARWLRAGMVVGAGMIVIPFAAALITVFVASRGPEGLRGATHRPEMAGKVKLAYIAVSAVAFAAPPGVLLFVMSGLALVGERKRRPELSSQSEHAEPNSDQQNPD